MWIVEKKYSGNYFVLEGEGGGGVCRNFCNVQVMLVYNKMWNPFGGGGGVSVLVADFLTMYLFGKAMNYWTGLSLAVMFSNFYHLVYIIN